jgi:hypothetical protein
VTTAGALAQAELDPGPRCLGEDQGVVARHFARTGSGFGPFATVPGRREQLREAAQRADRRLKGLRDNGDMLSGVRVAGEVYAVFEHIEPRDDRLPSWLDLTVPDDRFTASCLLLQAEHPGSALYVATGDMNLQTKLTAIGLPFIELPRLP